MKKISTLSAQKIEAIKKRVAAEFSAESLRELHVIRAIWEEEAKLNGVDYFVYIEKIIEGPNKSEHMNRMHEYLGNDVPLLVVMIVK